MPSSRQETAQSGFDKKKLSLVGQDDHTEEHVAGYHNVVGRMNVWDKAGASGEIL